MDPRGLAIIGNKYMFGEVIRTSMSLGINNSRVAAPFTWLDSGIQFTYDLYSGGSVQLMKNNATIASYDQITARQPSECDYFESFINLSRFEFYDNWRLVRYSIDLLLAAALIIALICLRKDKKIWDRMFSGFFGSLCTIAYALTGIVLTALAKQFQGFEYGYYTAMSVIHFSNFIRYTVQKIVQEHTVRTYDRIYDERRRIGNDNLVRLSQLVSREYVNVIIIWIAGVLVSPMIVFCYFDLSGPEPFIGFGTMVTVLKFAMPVIGVFVPAAIVFFFVKGSLDLLGYRREFIIMMIICLPLAILTFVVGLLDAVIDAHMLTKKIVLITVHAVCYILFDVCLIVCVSGITCLEPNRNGNKVFSDTSESTGSDLKPTRKQLLLKFIMDTDKDMLSKFCRESGNYTYFSFLKHLTSIVRDTTFEEKVSTFLKIHGSYSSANNGNNGASSGASSRGNEVVTGKETGKENKEKNKSGLHAEYKSIGQSYNGSPEDALIRLIYITEVYLVECVLRDGLFETDAYQSFLEVYEKDIEIFMKNHLTTATVDIEIEFDNISFDSSVMQFSE